MDEQSISKDESDDDSAIVMIPIRSAQGATNLTQENVDEVILKETNIINNIFSDESSTQSGSDNPYAKSTVSFTPPLDNWEDTAKQISIHLSKSQEITDEEQEAINRAAQCGAFFKSLGAETLIYSTSYGVSMLANGLLIRFAGLNPWLGSLLFGSTAALSYHTCRVVFTSLIKPPREKMPEDKKECFDIMKKYGFLPMSWFLRAGAVGSILSLLGDADYGTQQSIVVPASLTTGSVQAGITALTRKCLGGTVDIHPDYKNFQTPGEALQTIASNDPNPTDENRPFRFGHVRDATIRLVTMNISTLAFFAAGGTELATYCFGNPQGYLNDTSSANVTNVNQALNDNCFGGQFVFGFRELAFTLAYGLGVLIVEPLLAKAVNTIYDCFYPRNADDEFSDRGSIVEVDSDDESMSEDY